MKLYDNDSHRDTFTGLVYELLNDDPTWDRANQIIESYDSAPAVELPDTTLGGTYVNMEWLKRTEAELKKYKELAAHPQGGPGDDSIEIVKPAEDNPHTYLKPCRICGNTEIVYERYKHQSGERWRCWCTKCLACIDPGWAQSQSTVRDIWNQELPNDPLTLEELQELDGDKIFIRYIGSCKGFYKDEEAPYYGKFEQYVHEYNGMLRACDLPLKYYGETWLAYRRRTEEAVQT